LAVFAICFSCFVLSSSEAPDCSIDYMMDAELDVLGKRDGEMLVQDVDATKRPNLGEDVSQPQQHQSVMQSQDGGVMPEESRICFPFLNHGQCSRGSLCRFRHLEQDHPDAIADRVRTGHVSKLVGKLPADKVRTASLIGLVGRSTSTRARARRGRESGRPFGAHVHTRARARTHAHTTHARNQQRRLAE
jgi:hypothetical protein